MQMPYLIWHKVMHFVKKIDLAVKYFIASGEISPRKDIFLNLKAIILYRQWSKRATPNSKCM